MNLIHIIDLYNRIKENPGLEMQPRTFLFGAKAAAGYSMAKQIIRLACKLSEHLEKDPVVRDRIRVVFLENYSVSLSELIMPASDVSEQIPCGTRLLDKYEAYADRSVTSVKDELTLNISCRRQG